MRINWFDRDPDWKSVVGFRGKRDVESPFGQWTRMDVICAGSRITIVVNGVVVNKGFDASTTEGQIIEQITFGTIISGATACGLWCFAMLWVDSNRLPRQLQMSTFLRCLTAIAGLAMTFLGVMAIIAYF